jgi:hypothetical protein
VAFTGPGFFVAGLLGAGLVGVTFLGAAFLVTTVFFAAFLAAVAGLRATARADGFFFGAALPAATRRGAFFFPAAFFTGLARLAAGVFFVARATAGRALAAWAALRVGFFVAALFFAMGVNPLGFLDRPT